ncbi:MAG: DUF1080 domain-containing protein [Flavobacteriaceae bacterium]
MVREPYKIVMAFAFVAIGLSITVSCKQKQTDATPWISLFDGETLNGWIQKGGNANYGVVDGAIVGTAVADTPNSFLTSTNDYGDFILELEFKVDPKMNSGIQIRSNSYPFYLDGRVHGYQVEIDPSDRAWSAGIYDEGRRGWLHPLDDANVAAKKAFAQNDWNHYRVEAIGDTIQTWINGQPAANLFDDQTATGFIGLQVHSIYGDQKPGMQVAWRDIKIMTDELEKYQRDSPLPLRDNTNRLTKNESDQGWKMLWDGKTTNGWRGAKLEDFPEKGWHMENGVLTVLPGDGGESTNGGDIVTLDKYGNFELKVDFKLTEGANSGIKYYVDTQLNKSEGSAIGLEYQILDDAKHPDAKLGSHEGSRTLASLYDLIQASPDKPALPIGEWNTARILSKEGHVTHYLNGAKVLEYQRKSPEYRQLVAESKYKVWPNFGELEEGLILLQDHGDKVSFRNIKIRPIHPKKETP